MTLLKVPLLLRSVREMFWLLLFHLHHSVPKGRDLQAKTVSFQKVQHQLRTQFVLSEHLPQPFHKVQIWLLAGLGNIYTLLNRTVLCWETLTLWYCILGDKTPQRCGETKHFLACNFIDIHLCRTIIPCKERK